MPNGRLCLWGGRAQRSPQIPSDAAVATVGVGDSGACDMVENKLLRVHRTWSKNASMLAKPTVLHDAGTDAARDLSSHINEHASTPGGDPGGDEEVLVDSGDTGRQVMGEDEMADKKSAERAAARARKAGRRKAEREASRRERLAEEHARLINERWSDPDFARRERDADGNEWIQVPEFVMEALRDQRRQFVEKFGREPGPGDPLFFDPDADTPQQITPEKDFADFRAVVRKAGVDEAYADAYEELGYVVTEMNKHMFSLEEVEAFDRAIRRSRERRQ